MGRSKVAVRYQRVQLRSPARGRRKAQEPTIPEIRPRSPLGQYIAENADSGLPVWELIEQFQEYDCKHEWGEEPIGVTDQEEIYLCAECGLGKHKMRPGRII